MEKWTAKELVKELNRLGYRIDPKMSFNYYNNLNPAPGYNARSIYIKEIDTGKSFANIHSRRDDNFKELQKIRFNVEVINKSRTWEL